MSALIVNPKPINMVCVVNPNNRRLYFVSRVLVLVDGQVHEFDTPRVLMADDTSLFRAMVRKAGIACGDT